MDASLPLNSSTLNSKSGHGAYGETKEFPDLRPQLHLERLGGDIVNSITIHALAQANPDDAAEPVAVISNNDMTVKIYSLLRKQVIEELTHPTCMNYAIISPNSKILAALGDENYVYFYRRELNHDEVEFHDGKRLSSWTWQLFEKPALPSDGNSINDCCFTATFSPANHLCAVAAQNGIITVFDINVLLDRKCDKAEDSIICSFRSSRPRGLVTGAVRSMAFSPAPWDLLLWAEEFGCAGIADVRETFRRRQIIRLETHAEGVERINPEDLTDMHLRELDPENRMVHQFQEEEDPEARQWLRHSLSRNRAGHLPFAETREHLTPRERNLIESIRTSRSPEDTDVLESLLPDPRQAPYSVNYTPSRVSPSVLQAQDDTPARTARLRAVMSQFIRNIDSERSEDRTYAPRRRSSVVLSHSNQSSDRLAPQSDSRLRVTASPSRLSSTGMDLDESRPHSVSAALEASGAFALDEPESDRAESHELTDLMALMQYHQSTQAAARRSPQLNPDSSDTRTRSLYDLRRRLETLGQENRARLEATQREQRERRDLLASLNVLSRLTGSSTSVPERTMSSGSDESSLRELARAFEFDDFRRSTSEDLASERERHERQASSAEERARQLRHVLFAGEHSIGRSSALPTTNLTRSVTPPTEAQSTTSRERDRQSRMTQLLEYRRRVEQARTIAPDDSRSRRSSTPPNNQIPRNRSQSPTTRALSTARALPAVVTPGLSYAEAADSSRTQANDTSTANQSRPTSTASASTARPQGSQSLRQARLIAMQNAASRIFDANGNWMSEDIRHFPRSAGIVGVRSETWSEAGVGTAGVGWSHDGRLM